MFDVLPLFTCAYNYAIAVCLLSEAGDDAESESAELERLMLDLKEYDTLCQSQVSACLQHDVTSEINSTTPKRKLTSTPGQFCR